MQAASRRQAIISGPVGKTLVSLTWPMLFALIAIMGLGLVDSYFISFLGTKELAAIAFAMPITLIVVNIALGMGMAISSLNSKLIGANKTEQAARLISDGFILTSVVAVLVSLLLFGFMQTIFKLLGAQNETLPLINEYMITWSLGIVFLMLTQVCSSTFRSLGDTKTSAQISIVLTITNIVLDPLLIFGLGPFPELGLQGAALATLISVIVSCLLGLYRLGWTEKLLISALPPLIEFKNNLKLLLEIAIPAVLANAIVPLSAAITTAVIARHGTDAIAGFGVGTRIEAVSILLVYALSSTLPMFIGQNLGAGNRSRVLSALKLSFKFVIISQLVIYAFLAIFATNVSALFSDQESVRRVIELFLYILPISYGVSGIVILINVSLNVLEKAKVALYINILRMCLFYIPFALIGSYLLNVKGVFIGLSFGNLCAFIMAYLFLHKILKEQNVIDK